MTSLLNEVEKFFRDTPFPVPAIPSLPGRIGESPLSFYPQADEIDGKHVIKFPMPGVAKEDVTVKVTDGNRVTVGYTTTSADGNSNSARIYSAALPRHADPSTAKARAENGIVFVEFDAREGTGDVEIAIE